jgi:hypothetical protein
MAHAAHPRPPPGATACGAQRACHQVFRPHAAAAARHGSRQAARAGALCADAPGSFSIGGGYHRPSKATCYSCGTTPSRAAAAAATAATAAAAAAAATGRDTASQHAAAATASSADERLRCTQLWQRGGCRALASDGRSGGGSACQRASRDEEDGRGDGGGDSGGVSCTRDCSRSCSPPIRRLARWRCADEACSQQWWRRGRKTRRRLCGTYWHGAGRQQRGCGLPRTTTASSGDESRRWSAAAAIGHVAHPENQASQSATQCAAAGCVTRYARR